MGRRSARVAIITLAFILFLVQGPVHGFDSNGDVEEVIVTATRVATPIRQVGSSVTVITGEELEKKGEVFLSDALRDVPGLTVKRRGGFGSATFVFVRGLQEENVLVLVDGVEVNDPSSIGRTFDFANLTTENIERVEITRGPQSTLYGSDAISGVINIITKKGRGTPEIGASLEYGSYETKRTSISFAGGEAERDFSLALSRYETGGISLADEKNGNGERDGYRNTLVSARGSAEVVRWLRLEVAGRYAESEGDLDGFDFTSNVAADDLLQSQDVDEGSFRLSAVVECLEGRVESIFGFSSSFVDRFYYNDPFFGDTVYHGKTRKADYQENFYVSDVVTLTAGFEAEEEMLSSSFDTEKVARTEGYFGQVQYGKGPLSGTLGGRIDHHSRFGSEFTYRIQGAYRFSRLGTTLRASYGTGFKAPSLFHLFSSFGNPDLKAEKTKGFDAGLEQEISSIKTRLSLTWFYNDLRDVVVWDTTVFKYVNGGSGRNQGWEVHARVSPSGGLSIEGTYTYTHFFDNTDEDLTMGIPRHAGSVTLAYDFGDSRGGGTVALTARVKGKVRDFGGVTVPGYTVLNLSASYRVKEGITLTGRMENLLDREYEEVFGYGTPGISAFGGVTLTL